MKKFLSILLTICEVIDVLFAPPLTWHLLFYVLPGKPVYMIIFMIIGLIGFWSIVIKYIKGFIAKIRKK